MAAAMLAACSSSDGIGNALSESGLPRDAYAVDDGACPAPRCFEFAVPLPEGVNITDNRVRVILPEGYATSGKRYPLL